MSSVVASVDIAPFVPVACALGFSVLAYLMQGVAATRSAGEVMWKRVAEAPNNWLNHTLRSFGEFATWLQIIYWTTDVTGNIILSAILGSICGAFIVLMSHLIGQLLGRSLPKTNKCGSNFCLLFMVLAVSQQAIVFIFNYYNDIGFSILLASSAGIAFNLAAEFFSRWKPTKTAGIVLQNRMANTALNWKYNTGRTMFEIACWLGSMFLSYAFDNDFFRAVQVSLIVGVLVVILNGEGRDPIELQKLHMARRKSLEELGDHAALEQMGRGRILALPLSVSEKKEAENVRLEHTEHILIDGEWYDVSKFIEHHPGGAELLRIFLAKDCTEVFYSFHRDPKKLLKRFKAIGTQSEDSSQKGVARRAQLYRDFAERLGMGDSDEIDRFNLDEFNKEFSDMREDFRAKGYMEPNQLWLISRVCLMLAFLLVCVAIIVLFPEWPLVAGVFLGLFWHQGGFLMHDAEHHTVCKKPANNDLAGWFFGNVVFGLSGQWWRFEHNYHHAITNTCDEDGARDPQMAEDIWIQDRAIMPFYKQWIHDWILPFQHLYFVPLVMVFGRFGIILDCARTLRDKWEWFGIILHCSWISGLLYLTPYPIYMYFCAAVWQSLLSFQLVGNHYLRPFDDIEDCTDSSFVLRQILVSQDYKCAGYMEWFFGGLNFHVCHHVFPRMNRSYFRPATDRLLALLKKHGVPHSEIGFLESIVSMYRNFDDIAKDYVAVRGVGALA